MPLPSVPSRPVADPPSPFIPPNAPQSLAAKAYVEREYRGADHLGQRGPRWNQSNHVNQHLHRRDVAVSHLLSTAVNPSAANHAAVREAVRRGDIAYGSRSITFTRNGAMEGYNGWKSSVAVSPAELDAMNRERAARETRAAKTASEKMLKKTGYLPPWKLEERKMATMRELKAKGHWPEPPPPVEVLECTRRAKTRRADVLAVLELDDFVAPADEEETRGKRRW